MGSRDSYWARCSYCTETHGQTVWREDCVCGEWDSDDGCGCDCCRGECDSCGPTGRWSHWGTESDYDEYVLLQWVLKVRPWIEHGGNPLMDLLEELSTPEEERPAHGWTAKVLSEMGLDPYCHCDCCGIEYCDIHKQLGGSLLEWEDWAEELVRRRNHPLAQLNEALNR